MLPVITLPHRRTLRAALVCLAAVLLVAASEGGTVPALTPAPAIEKELSSADWKRLQELRVYFGHQSVGQNIIDGIGLLTRAVPDRKLAVKKIAAAADIDGPLLAHSFLGENGEARSKMRAFREMLQAGIGDRVDAALFKLCYIDVTAYSDVDALFAEYRSLLDELRQRYPRTVFIHTTVPLTVSRPSLRSFIKSLIGKEDNNVRRNRFNELVRRHAGGREPLFDIALAESRKSDGSRSTFTANGRVYESLAPEYSDDGGHLNDRGKEAVARELLRVLRDHVRR